MERDTHNGPVRQSSLTWAYTLWPVGGLPPIDPVDALLMQAGGLITDAEIRRVVQRQKQWIKPDNHAG